MHLMRGNGGNQGGSGRLMTSASSLISAETREKARLPCFAGNEGRRTTTTDGLAIDDTRYPRLATCRYGAQCESRPALVLARA